MTVPRARLVAVNQAAAEYFTRNLRESEGNGPRAYLSERGLDQALEDPAWTIGYALREWTGLLDTLRVEGFGDEEVGAAGLAVVSRRNTLIDRFRDRIVFGLRDSEATLVGFVGRCPPHASPRTPKYLNSPSTEVFDKSSVLFGLAEQRTELQRGAIPVVVEGPLDALAVRQLGRRRAAVSPCGARLTSQHADLLRRASSTDCVVLANDCDEPGREGTRRAYDLLAPNFTRVLAAAFSAGEDPASVAARDHRLLGQALGEAGPAADLIVDLALAPYLERLDNAEARVCALHAATRVVACLAENDVSRQVVRLSERLDFTTTTVTEDVCDALNRVSSCPHGRQVLAHPQPVRLSADAASRHLCPPTSRKELP